MEDLMYLYTHIDLFLLVFLRIVCAFIFLPIIEESKIPALAVGAISTCLAYITVITIGSTELVYQPTLVGFMGVAIKECIVGILLAFGVRLFFQIYYFVGTLLGMQGGLGMSMMFDPVNSAQIPILGRFYMLGFSAIFIVSGGYHWFIKTLIESFRYIPLNLAFFRPQLIGSIVDSITIYWLVSFKLAIPVLAILLLIDCGLGILARTAPQMNMFVIGLPLKMIVLFILLIFTIQLNLIYNDIIIKEIIDMVTNIIQGMIP